MRLGRSNSLIQDIDRGGVRPLILWRVGDRTIDVYDQMLVQRLGRSGWHRKYPPLGSGNKHRSTDIVTFMQHPSEKEGAGGHIGALSDCEETGPSNIINRADLE